jgi:hypothetical protein
MELRKNLESIQSKHEGQGTEGAESNQEELQSLREELEEANESKEHFETQYNNLLGRVNTIKTTLGNRLKADAVGLMCRLQNETYADSHRQGSRNTKLKSPNSRTRIVSSRTTTVA